MSATTSAPSQTVTADIAIIGGTGVYNMDGVENKVDLGYMETPFGKTSSKVIVGQIFGESVAFIARHDTTHRLLPTEVPYRANIYALKTLGVRYLLTFGAVGSLQEKAAPSHIVLPDQFIDRTKDRPSTFFGNGVVAHVSFGDPVCNKLRAVVKKAITENLPEITTHDGGAYVCMEGPAFSTRAESNMYRMLGGTVIGMTALQEAKLAREAEIAYTVVALVTDYDCWHEGVVTVEEVMAVLKKNSQTAQLIMKEVLKSLSKEKPASASHTALQGAIMTHSEVIPEETKQNLKAIIGKYIH